MQLVTQSGESIYIEMDVNEGLVNVGAENVIKRTQEEFDQALQVVMLGADSLLSSVKSLGNDLIPEEVSWEFGIKFDAEFGAVIAKYSAGGNFNVKLTWKLSKPRKK
jgi:hypothetical protein